jgi:DNA-binding CsgD family transcriptional regulator
MGWPPSSEIYADIPSWSAVNTGNIFESYATCVFLKANREARSALRSILWAAILAEPRAARQLARHCKSKGRDRDIPSDILEVKETPYINLGDEPFPPSEEEEEEDPNRGTREAKAMAAAAVAAAESSAVRLVADGVYVNNTQTTAAIDSDLDFKEAKLSPREREVLTLYASGMALKQVAFTLNIKMNTAKEHIDRVRTKYADIGRPVSSKTELLLRAIEDGLIDGSSI